MKWLPGSWVCNRQGLPAMVVHATDEFVTVEMSSTRRYTDPRRWADEHYMDPVEAAAYLSNIGRAVPWEIRAEIADMHHDPARDEAQDSIAQALGE